MKKYKHKTKDIYAHQINDGGYNIVEKYNFYTVSSWLVEEGSEWEEIVDKNYEILSFKRICDPCDRGLAYLQKSGGYLHLPALSSMLEGAGLEWMLKSKDYLIHSIKRLSDGEVFTVGDKAVTKQSNYGIIVEFENKFNDIYITTRAGTNRCKLKDLKPIKKPILTTEDGVDMFEGDIYWRVYENSKIYGGTATKHSGLLEYDNFSTKEAAEEYVLMNKPCLSIKDVQNKMFNIIGEPYYSNITRKLKESVKSKLK